MIMNQTSGLFNHTDTYTQPPVSISVTVFVFIVTVWAVLANCTIVTCFIINRSKIWPNFSVQILSLSVSDICVGLASLPFCLLPLANAHFSFRSCSVLYAIFFTSQCATLYHIFGICIHRLIIINKTSLIGKRSDSRMSIILVISAWGLSAVVSFLLILIYGSPEAEVRFCLANEIFKGKMSQVTGFVLAIYFVPQLSTNILYIIACIRLRQIWKKVFPNPETNPGMILREAAPVSNPAPTNPNISLQRTDLKMQRNVICTISALLLIFNFCTIPLLVILRMENQNKMAKRDLRYVVCALFTLNSALNPFVYAFRTKWLKIALKNFFSRIFCRCYYVE